MFNKDRFHNQLALNLGYQCIVKDKRITIEVDEADDPWVTLKFQGYPDMVRFKASGDANAAYSVEASELRNRSQGIEKGCKHQKIS